MSKIEWISVEERLPDTDRPILAYRGPATQLLIRNHEGDAAAGLILDRYCKEKSEFMHDSFFDQKRDYITGKPVRVYFWAELNLPEGEIENG